tara:strand:+ start:19216 stop:20307 length:1092 start_codon:yes stop_codon:yes gene_type:complete
MGLNKKLLNKTAAVSGTAIYDGASYTGNGTGSSYCGADNSGCGTKSIAIDFIPDLFFVKSTDTASGWIVGDSYRGNFNYITFQSNNANGSGCATGFPNDPTACSPQGTAGVGNATTYGGTPTSNIVAIDNSLGWWGANKSGAAYMAYGFNGSGGVSASNSVGDVTSTVYANSNGSFSVAGYTSITGSSASTYVGVGITPEFAMWKRLDATNDWFCWLQSEGKYGVLNDDANFIADGSTWFSGNKVLQNTSASGQHFVVYSFASVAGVSKVGTYDGDGNATHAITGVGFQPSFLMIKSVTVDSTNWEVYDSNRSAGNRLSFNSTAIADDNSSAFGSLDADGFTVKGTSGGTNASGEKYMYLAFK